jgi:hypothetical protein
MLFKATALSLGLLAGIAAAAQAQTASSPVTPGQSLANLPMPGPRPSSLLNIPNDHPHAVVQSGNYPGPVPGATNGVMPPRFQKPTDWDSNVAMHPYQEGVGPKPN